MDLKKEFTKLCDPAKFYLLISFASVVVYGVHLMGKDRKKYSIEQLGIHVVLMVVWTLVLNKVCSFKYGVKISWFLVFLPILFLIILMVFVFKMMDQLDLTKHDLHKMIDQANKTKDDDDLEGFQGCDK
tara:strand:- start:36 stop:422 length:387 start_codon:yes stop_codon:yes gene_type:complete